MRNRDLRDQVLLLSYSLERDDERSYWTNISTLILTLVGGLIALGSFTDRIHWAV